MPKRTVSCQQCRLRKVKCDRGHPCSQCTADPENPRVCRYGAFNQQAQPQPFVPAAGAAPQPQLAGGMGDANMPLLDPLVSVCLFLRSVILFFLFPPLISYLILLTTHSFSLLQPPILDPPFLFFQQLYTNQ
jgi:hypothetical protein